MTQHKRTFHNQTVTGSNYDFNYNYKLSFNITMERVSMETIYRFWYSSVEE